jgi:ureidoglycolate lyase
MEILPQPLTPDAFAPFGEVIEVPQQAGRTSYDDALGNTRPHAKASLSMTYRLPSAERPLVCSTMERHEFSSQSFVPVDVERWLIVVAPHAATGGPDMAAARAFIAGSRQGVTYKPNTWHHGLTTLGGPGRFAVFMWRAGEKDEEFVPVAPFTIKLS